MPTTPRAAARDPAWAASASTSASGSWPSAMVRSNAACSRSSPDSSTCTPNCSAAALLIQTQCRSWLIKAVGCPCVTSSRPRRVGRSAQTASRNRTPMSGVFGAATCARTSSRASRAETAAERSNRAPASAHWVRCTCSSQRPGMTVRPSRVGACVVVVGTICVMTPSVMCRSESVVSPGCRTERRTRSGMARLSVEGVLPPYRRVRGRSVSQFRMPRAAPSPPINSCVVRRSGPKAYSRKPSMRICQ